MTAPRTLRCGRTGANIGRARLAAAPPARPGEAADAVDAPVNTPFLSAARAQGIRIRTGFDLFHQMARALPGLAAPKPQEEHHNV